MLPVKATILSLCLLFPSLILVVLYYRRQWRSVSCPPAVLSSAGNVNQSNTLKLHSKGIVEVQFAVPERLVGYVIGRRGTHIHKIQDETGAKVRVKERLDNGDKVYEKLHAAMYTRLCKSNQLDRSGCSVYCCVLYAKIYISAYAVIICISNCR